MTILRNFRDKSVKVKVAVAFLYKKSHLSRAFTYEPILVLSHINVKYDNILEKFEFECSEAKVKVTFSIFRKTLPLLWRLPL